MRKKFCEDCGLPSSHHIHTWLEEIINLFLPQATISNKLEQASDVMLEKFFSFLGLVRLEANFSDHEIQSRSACFIKEARSRGVEFKALKGPFGYTNNFCAKKDGKVFRFESLPLANFASRYDVSFVDCKERTKKHLAKGGFPIAEGKTFWAWQKIRALKYGTNELGFPLVVKPRNGSVSRHVTTNINNEEDLRRAINLTIKYSPAFIVEKFIENSFVYRATVVDFDYVACVRQSPANVVGDGVSTIQELVSEKNNDERRGESDDKKFILHKLVIDKTSESLLESNGYDLYSTPRNGEVVYLQKDPFLKLGGDLIDVTSDVHRDNLRLFKDVAKFFDIRLVGMDFLIPDITLSWKDQNCAMLELNSAPCIEMHHCPSSGDPRNVAGAVADLFFKYYV